ncbi:MAG TPA: hypothetical protein VLZ53_06130 [Devosia sp.]|nr:hypothetical protein [Devosia sp.]
MATAGQISLTPQRRRIRRLLFWLLVLAAGLLAWFWQPLNSYAVTGASYGARVACSCRYVGGRSLSDCGKDFEPDMELITLSEDKGARSVTARFLVLSSQTATYRKGEGCVLEPWED